MNQTPAKPNGFLQPRKIDFTHYIKLLFEKKYLIIIITVLVTAIWIMIYPIFLRSEKIFQLTSIIRFDDPRVSVAASGIDERFTIMDAESKISIVKTREFLAQVVDSLHLNIQSRTPGLTRKQIFSSIYLADSLAGYGRYTMKRANNQINVFYTNIPDGYDNTLVYTAEIDRFDSSYVIKINGLNLTGLSVVYKKYKTIEFICIPTRNLLEHLSKSIKYTLNSRQTLLGISYENRDPYLGAEVVNVISDLFLRENLKIKKFRTTSALASLEDQLATSKLELEKIENELTYYRQLNPRISISETMDDINQELMRSESTLDEIERNLKQINRLNEEKNQASGEDEINLIYLEIGNFLQAQNLTGISAVLGQYSSELQKRERLINLGYSEENPNLIEINTNLKSLKEKIDERLNWFVSEQTKKQGLFQENIQTSERRLQQNPAKELKLARLMREREAKSRIYSQILVRYNEVKISHESITPDAFLLEKAEVPIIEYTIMERLLKYIKLGIGPLLGFFLSIVLIVGLDFLWHRARSEEDIAHLLGLPSLASIPIIKKEKSDLKDFTAGKKMDDKLVTIDYSPGIEAESFRNLRTKLILNHQNNQKQTLIVTSYLPGEGKSLISANLAVTFAQLKQPTLLVDGDMRRGVQHNTFVCDKRPGLSDFLAKAKNIDSKDISKIIQKTSVPYLDLIPSGQNIPNPTELLIGENMKQFLDVLLKKYQYIIIDSPPIEFLPDAFVLNNLVRNLLLVLRYGKTDVNKVKKILKNNSAQISGVRGIILNGAQDVIPKKYYKYSYYKY